MPDTTPGFKLEVGGTLPGEALVVALVNAAAKGRDNMSQENRDKWDAAAYQAYRDWNNFWVEVLHWPGTKL